jgi:HAD superfamily phosphatase
VTLIVTPQAAGLRAKLDTVVFDIDGVLIDISKSIRRVNCLAPAFYLRNVLGWKSSDDILTSDDIELYKHAGGFNDDWDLTYVIVLSYLVKGQIHGCQDADVLNAIEPNHASLTKRIAACGGGQSAAETILFRQANMRDGIDLAGIRRDYDYVVIRQVFEEILAGDLCERMYQHPAVMYHGRGLIYEDRCLLDHNLLPSGKKIGMQTGRTYEEAKIGREFCGLEEFLPDTNCVTKRDGFDKPNPGGLELLAARLGTQSAGIYIGDTLDDLRTVRNLNALGTTAPFASALVLTGPAGEANESLFRNSGADLIGKDVNEVLAWINGSE